MVQCVICKDSKLEQIEPNVLKCKICKNQYVLGYEILKHEEEISDPYSDDPDIELSGLSGVNEPVEICDSYDFKEKESNDIPIPKYMKDSSTTKVIYFREE